MNTFEIVATIFFALLFLVGLIGTRLTRGRKNPDAEEMQRKRAEAYRLKREKESQDEYLESAFDGGYLEEPEEGNEEGEE